MAFWAVSEVERSGTGYVSWVLVVWVVRTGLK